MKTILVVDDEPALRGLLVDLLGSERYNTLEASNGQEALDMLEREPVDLMVSDLKMPEVNGLDLILGAKARRPAMKVIAMSGGGGITGDMDYLPVAQLAGADVILQKPFDNKALLASVRQLLSPAT